ncbi:MAG: DNA/RNA non-specific endonuclease [Bacteroidales bacterium]|nr:DNA/RNA non-specific endonuclease [Bacteroidales bacterium]
MKLRHLIIVALGAVSLFASCGPELEPAPQETASVKVSPSSLSFSVNGGSEEVKVTTNCNWTAESDSDWAVLNITSGGISNSGAVVKVTVQANKGDARNATVTFTGKGNNVVTTKLTISQEAYVPAEQILTVSPTTLNMAAAGQTASMTLKATGDWTAAANASWITIDKASGSGSDKSQVVTVTAAANTEGERSGKLTFTMGDKTASVTISQYGTIQAQTVTIAEFIEKSPDSDDWYRITGTITQICDNTAKAYGNFYIKDATGELFVYGMTKEFSENLNDQSFSQIGLKEGDELTFFTQRSEYHGEPQGGGNKQPAYYESHVPGTTPARVDADYKAPSTSEPWLELPATSAEDGHTFLHHTMFFGSQEARSFSMYWDSKNLVSRWVAYPLYRKAMGYGTRTDRWGLDPLLSSNEQPVLDRSYESLDGNSYDRGHQIPSADRYNYEANVKTFYYTNMTPQLNDLNGALWADLENNVREWAWPDSYETDTLYVVTGCIVDDSDTFVKDNDGKQVTVPTHYYKALLRLYQGNYNAIGFWLDHKKYDNNKVDKSIAVSIDELETLTGEDFFVNLPDGIESIVEAADPKTDIWWWNNMRKRDN